MSDHVLTIPAFLTATVERRGDEPALGTIRDGKLRWHTWREVDGDAHALAATLRDAGIRPGDRVGQVSENRYEWIIADLALNLTGAVHVPIHVTLAGAQIAEQIAASGAQLAFVSNAELLAKFRENLDPSVAVEIHDHRAIAGELRLAGEAKTQAEIVPTREDALVTILFTSGTTGRPRGVMLSQRNLASNAAAVSDAFGAGEETRLSILPLSHIYARTCDLYTWLYRGSRLVLAENRETLLRDCQLVRPTALNAVPYVYQRIADRVRQRREADEAAALAAEFGGKMKLLVCGGAAIGPEVEAWYAERGLPILPGYGLSEASPVIAVSTPDVRRLGTVGKPISGVEVRIADDGEVLARGPNVMLGYWQAGGTSQHEDMIHNGWLHTGDLGALDADGFLSIRGRKKELIVLSTGKKVSPTRVENLLTASPWIEQAVVFGDGRPHLVALVVPSAAHKEAIAGGLAANGADSLAAEIGGCLATAAHEEQVRDFAILDRPFSIERGELTPKLSLCRSVIARNFATELDAIKR